VTLDQALLAFPKDRTTDHSRRPGIPPNHEKPQQRVSASATCFPVAVRWICRDSVGGAASISPAMLLGSSFLVTAALLF
jgi:hypothetical protein